MKPTLESILSDLGDELDRLGLTQQDVLLVNVHSWRPSFHPDVVVTLDVLRRLETDGAGPARAISQDALGTRHRLLRHGVVLWAYEPPTTAEGS